MRRRGREPDGGLTLQHNRLLVAMLPAAPPDTPTGAHTAPEGEGQDRALSPRGPRAPQHDLHARVPGRERDQVRPVRARAVRGDPRGRQGHLQGGHHHHRHRPQQHRPGQRPGRGHQRLQVQPHKRRAPGERQRPAHARLEGEGDLRLRVRGQGPDEGRRHLRVEVQGRQRLRPLPMARHGRPRPRLRSQRGGHGREADGTA